ncbi:hypothetical protein [Shewanella halifaxensis]|uniref:hypothetical protein n=1 Tax=Shewanella halifaxensis TaxID=271098 RepID=UPI000D59A0F2|nr:hypothetical protein [Shewanella halifaxensis]
MKINIRKNIVLLLTIFSLTACGSHVVTKQVGIAEQQIIYVVGKELVGYKISIGNIQGHKISSSDLEDDPVHVLTSADNNLQNSDVLKVIVASGTNHLEITNNRGRIVYKNDVYLSQGQSTFINVK